MSRNTSSKRTAQTFPVRIHRDHVLAEIGGKTCLIDTGSHLTWSLNKSIEVMGQKFDTEPQYGPMSLAELSGYVGRHLDYLIGMDVLGAFPWRLDWNKRELEFYEDYVPNGEVKNIVECGDQAAVIDSGARPSSMPPVVGFKIEGVPQIAILDTGAPYQYGPRSAQFGRYIGEKDDFSPFWGKHKADAFETSFEFGGRKWEKGVFCKLKPGTPTEFGWLLGADILKAGPIVFDLRRDKRRIYLL